MLIAQAKANASTFTLFFFFRYQETQDRGKFFEYPNCGLKFEKQSQRIQ